MHSHATDASNWNMSLPTNIKCKANQDTLKLKKNKLEPQKIQICYVNFTESMNAVTKNVGISPWYRPLLLLLLSQR